MIEYSTMAYFRRKGWKGSNVLVRSGSLLNIKLWRGYPSLICLISVLVSILLSSKSHRTQNRTSSEINSWRKNQSTTYDQQSHKTAGFRCLSANRRQAPPNLPPTAFECRSRISYSSEPMKGNRISAALILPPPPIKWLSCCSSRGVEY